MKLVTLQSFMIMFEGKYASEIPGVDFTLSLSDLPRVGSWSQ